MLPLPGLGGPEEHNSTLESEVAALAEGSVGQLGVAAQLLGDDSVIAVNGDRAFPMASTYKVAIAVAVLRMVDTGALDLKDMVTLRDEEWVFSPIIATNFIHPGVALSVANLVEVMITQSDNTATDACLRLVGGPAAVTGMLRELGIMAMRVDRNTGDILKDFYGLEASGRNNMAKVGRYVSDNSQLLLHTNPTFETDDRDKATPAAMLSLLLAIAEGRALNPDTTAFLLGAMSRTVTRPQRLGAFLPSGTPVAHKTGSIGGVANDVGYISLPDGRKFAVAIYTRGGSTPLESREQIVAKIASALYRYYAGSPK